MVDSERKLRDVIFIGCVGTTIYALFVLIKNGVLAGSERIYIGEMYDPNDLAYFMVSFLPFGFLFLSRGNALYRRILSIAMLVMSPIVILSTQSRGGFIAMCFVSIWLMASKSLTVKRGYKMIAIVLILIGLIVVLPDMNLSHLSSITQLETDYNMFDETGRLAIWREGISLMISYPFTGVGVNCFQEAIGRYRAEQNLQETWQTSHNSLIQIGTETGIIGLCLYLIITIKAFNIFNRARKFRFLDGLASIGEMAKIGFLGNFIGSMFLSQAYSIYWIFYLALSSCIQGLIENSRQNSPYDHLD